MDTEISLRDCSRLIAMFLILTMLGGWFGELYVPSRIITADAATTAAQLRNHAVLFRLGFAAYLVEAVSDLVLAWLFYILLRPVHRDLALLSAFFGVVSMCLFAVTQMFYFSAPLFLSGRKYLTAFPPEQLAALSQAVRRAVRQPAGTVRVLLRRRVDHSRLPRVPIGVSAPSSRGAHGRGWPRVRRPEHHEDLRADRPVGCAPGADVPQRAGPGDLGPRQRRRHSEADSANQYSELDYGMAYEVDFANVSTVGLESSPVAAALAGLRANEARYFKNKYGQAFVVEPAKKAKKLVDYVHRILKEERDIVIASRPLEAAELHVENIRWTFVFYESGLAVNVLYTLDDKKKRAVGFKLSDGMEVPAELASRFKFAKQKSKLAGTIRGSYFVIKGEY
jgi:hypothetical protein